uniref:Uncharacterized protein n=1 Tax=Dulem virus 29 TaxID=3145747 RepID=A0AAU8AX71_9CAUD
MIEIDEIKGIKGLYAFKALQTLLLSYFFLPEFKKENETYEAFLCRFSESDEDEKRKILNNALYFAGIEPREIEALVCMAKDKNGIHYSRSNINNLSLEELFNLVIDVCMAVCDVKVFF